MDVSFLSSEMISKKPAKKLKEKRGGGEQSRVRGRGSGRGRGAFGAATVGKPGTFHLQVCVIIMSLFFLYFYSGH
jgi:hypothetical protein